ncbi:PREDICTED: coagulation factor XII [Nanorana parkeri]|uniref:coagulation factor XII n=1 Tax=Nanorana parkeri TaxID=125878 RepID=UPI00085436F8|nr:PREDICTED: coagulation factor XII [Nanorana parkeri]
MKLLLIFVLLVLAIAQAKPRRRERVKHKPGLGGLVLTETGQLCHFPFHHARMLHHTCIRRGRLRPWCSLTGNFDKDKLWSFCVEGSKVTDHCEDNPCEPRGICKNTLRGYNCVCHEPYTGKNCKKDKCFDATLLQYFEPQDKWLRYKHPILEECTCGEKETVCKVTTGMRCSDNSCLHGGHCIKNKNSKVCGCTQGYIGPYCGINKNENCFSGNGTSYRGTAKVTVTGTPCLNWESDIIHHEVSIYSGHHAKKHGIGPHSYCRNPDGDIQPWCFVEKNEVLSWEHCDIPHCQQPTGSKPPTQTNKPPLPTKTPSHPISTTVPHSTAASKDVNRAIPVECGKRFLKSPSMTPRIVGGLVALPASHPYMAAIYIGEQFCGGSLISSCWVVTAAHCLDHKPSVKTITVVLGQSLFNTTDQRTVKFPVHKYILHKLYSDDTFQHDIALVKLQGVNGVCAQFSQFVQPACLPQSTMTAASAQNCEVVGWGHQYDGADHYAFYLQEAQAPILSSAQCKSPLSHGSKIMAGMMCAGSMEGGVDACQGDSGGPLVCEVDSRVQLFGVVSWGSGCAEENKPGVYTDVPKYTEWILTNID